MKDNFYTDEKIKNELSFKIAMSISRDLLEQHLLSQKEFKLLTDINRQTFPPLFSEIMPKELDK
ncbi:MAG: SHOCT domain-containing protein [Atopobium minutum]|nr:SHOCT domain-containing protein [Atopobium minutum]